MNRLDQSQTFGRSLSGHCVAGAPAICKGDHLDDRSHVGGYMSKVHVLIDRYSVGKCSVVGDGATGAGQELTFGRNIQTHSRKVGLKIRKSRLGRLTYGGVVQQVTLLCVLDLPDDITKLGCYTLISCSDYD